LRFPTLIASNAKELSARRSPIRFGAFFAIHRVAPIAVLSEPGQQLSAGRKAISRPSFRDACVHPIDIVVRKSFPRLA